jgi:S1-C subfamily serine protease
MFTDVDPNKWYAKDIERVAKAGRMVGDGDKFRPDEPITRAEIASLEARRLAWDGSFKDVLPSIMPAVITLYFGGALGSGFFVTGDGHIITNKHVAECSTTGTMTVIKDGMPNVSAKLLAVSSGHDLALFKVDFAPPAYLKLATADCERGDHVGVIGSPKGYVDSFCQGVVSNPRRAGDPVTAVIDCFQLDAPISPGNSGGPVISEAGEVVGVECTKWVSIDAEGLAWAIHAKYVREFCRLNGVAI